MGNAELLKNWNDVVPFKIKENDLIKPSENFVFKALLSLLQLFNYDTELMQQKAINEDSEAKRLFKIEFCRIVEKLYKISDKSHSFVYYDLIRPSPKKTVHLLKYLLNYLLYCNMIRQEVFSRAEKELQEYEEVLSMKTNSEIENEKIERRANMINKKLNECGRDLQIKSEQIVKLTREKQILDEKITKMEDKAKMYDDSILLLQSKINEIQSGIVSKDEADNLLTKKSALEAAIEEQKEIERVTRDGNEKRSSDIESLNQNINLINSVMEMHLSTPGNFTSVRELQSKVVEMNKEFALQSALNEKMISEIAVFNEKVEKNKKLLKERKLEIYERLTQYEKENLTKTELKKEKKYLNDKLNEALHKVEIELLEQESNYSYMLQSAAEMFTMFSKIPELGFVEKN